MSVISIIIREKVMSGVTHNIMRKKTILREKNTLFLHSVPLDTSPNLLRYQQQKRTYLPIFKQTNDVFWQPITGKQFA